MKNTIELRKIVNSWKVSKGWSQIMISDAGVIERINQKLSSTILCHRRSKKRDAWRFHGWGADDDLIDFDKILKSTVSKVEVRK